MSEWENLGFQSEDESELIITIARVGHHPLQEALQDALRGAFAVDSTIS